MRRSVFASPRRLFISLCCCCALFPNCGGGPTPNAPANSSTPTGTPATSAEAQANPRAGALANSRPPKPAEVVGLIADEVELRAGASSVAEVRLSVARGYHVNANPATEKFLVPTEIKLEPAEGVAAGAPVYPAAVMKRFAFSEKPLAVYEGEATIRLPLRAAAVAARGSRTLRTRVRYQACDEEKCYPPASVEASVPVTIR